MAEEGEGATLAAMVTSSSSSISLVEDREVRKKRVLQLLRDAAAQAVRQGDPWARKWDVSAIPAERVIRHLYHPLTERWTTDETIVKIEKEPFTHGAMRFCYRMKKRAQPPADAHNHRFHRHGWAYASNYVAKAYTTADGEIDTSDEAKQCVRNDVMLQYEAQHWAELFNAALLPTKIHFIRAYAIEFPNRSGRPWLAVERFIAGKDYYGAGFTKHNTNAGYVDQKLRRVTPQVFSAFSFYASQGHRLVADIQGVGDLYTDPQVLSSDYRFGDGDLGPRGMAMFFRNFRSCGSSDAMGIPIFPLSKNEINCQTKYEDDEITLSDEESSQEGIPIDTFQRLDMNRRRRSLALKTPLVMLPLDLSPTFRRSNLTLGISTSKSARRSSAPAVRGMPKPRTKSSADEVKDCLQRARSDMVFTHYDFHRHAGGELRERQFKDEGDDPEPAFHRSNHTGIVVSLPMTMTDTTRMNLGRVHYQLAYLHGIGRFPEVVPSDDSDKPEDPPTHDAVSVLFHLSHAAALHNAPACLALARLQAGFESEVSDLLTSIVPTDFDAAKILLQRAMSSPHPPSKPKAAAGCLLVQILKDERPVEGGTVGANKRLDAETMQVLEDTLQLFDAVQNEEQYEQQHKAALQRGGGFCSGDRVEADYALEGTYYSAVVESVVDKCDGKIITVRYDDDGSSESLASDHVRRSVPSTATQTSSGGPLSDGEAFGSDYGGCDDDILLFSKYELEFDLAQLKEASGDAVSASALYVSAADGAMADGKMKWATEWSLKAAGLQK